MEANPAGPMSLPSLDDVLEARKRIARHVLRTPLVRVQSAKLESDWPELQVYVKLENLQRTGSFEDRAAANVLLCAVEKDSPPARVVTASTGNFAQGLARHACDLNIPLTVLAPERLPNQKRRGLEAYGAEVRLLQIEAFFEALTERPAASRAQFVRPSGSPEILAGIGTVALEILDDLPDVDAIAVAFGSGGLACGIGLVLQALRPQTKLIACESATAAPLHNAMQAGRPVACRHQPTFIDGVGLESVFPDLWAHIRRFVTRTVKVSLSAVANAIRFLVMNMNIVAEGAGAASLAAALAGDCGKKGKIVCIISGGNIDMDVLADILHGVMPLTAVGSRQQLPAAAARLQQLETNF